MKKSNKLMATIAVFASLLLSGCDVGDRYEIKGATIIGTEGTGREYNYVINVETKDGQKVSLHGRRYIHEYEIGSKINVRYRGNLRITEIQLVGSDKVR